MATFDILINNRFRLESKISSGAFGVVYRGLDIHTGDRVAIKLESANVPTPQLSYEFRVYEALQSSESPEARIGIPRVHWYGREGQYFVLVIDLLGCSLEDLFNICNRKFSLKTTLMLADQLISRIQYMHAKGYLHRDIKPDNFVIGREEFFNCIFSIDFGLAKRYRDPETLKHIPYANNRSLIGTARYTSVHSHIGAEQSRRDDLEAIGYVLIYFLKGSLPWQGLKGGTKAEKFSGINDSKMKTSLETLCLGLPHEFLYFFQHIRALAFEEKPDYLYLRRLFRELFQRLGYVYDLVFDWTIPLKQSKYASAIFSQTSLTLKEQIHTNTNFLINMDAADRVFDQNNNNNQYSDEVDFTSMSFVLDNDVINYYREVGKEQESYLYKDIAQRYNIEKTGGDLVTLSLLANNNNIDGIGVKNIDVAIINNNGNNNNNTTQSIDTQSQMSINSTGKNFDPEITEQAHEFNKNGEKMVNFGEKNTKMGAKIDNKKNDGSGSEMDLQLDNKPLQAPSHIDIDGNERDSNNNYVNSPLFDVEVASWTNQLCYLLNVKSRDDQQEELLPDVQTQQSTQLNLQQLSIQYEQERNQQRAIHQQEMFQLDKKHQTSNISGNQRKSELQKLTAQQEHQKSALYQRHHQAIQQRKAQDQLQLRENNKINGKGKTNGTVVQSNGAVLSQQDQSQQQLQPLTPTNAANTKVSQPVVNYEVSLHQPTTLEMVGTIQFAQKQFHTFTLFLQLLCKQLIYIENALTLIHNKNKVLREHELTQLHIDNQYQPLLNQTFGPEDDENNNKNNKSLLNKGQNVQKGNQNQPEQQYLSQSIDQVSNGGSTASSASNDENLSFSHSSTTSSTFQSPLVSANPHTSLLDIHTPQQASWAQNVVAKTIEEVKFLFEMQTVVLEQQLQYTRQQQQLVMNCLICLHHYLRSLLIEHQHHQATQIASKSTNNGFIETVLFPAQGRYEHHIQNKVIYNLQAQRQLLQAKLKKFYMFDYSALTDQRNQVQRLYAQVKTIQNVKEQSFFQFMNILRQKTLLPYHGHPFLPNLTLLTNKSSFLIQSPNGKGPNLQDGTIVESLDANGSNYGSNRGSNTTVPSNYTFRSHTSSNKDSENNGINNLITNKSIGSNVDGDNSTKEHNLPVETQQQLYVRSDPNAILIGGPLTPITAVHANKLTPYNDAREFLGVQVGPIRDFLDLHQRIISLVDNETLVVRDQEHLLQLSNAAVEVVDVLEKHQKHMEKVNVAVEKDIEQIGVRQHNDKLTLRDHVDDSSNNSVSNNGTTTTSSGLKLMKGKVIRRGVKNDKNNDKNDKNDKTEKSGDKKNDTLLPLEAPDLDGLTNITTKSQANENDMDQLQREQLLLQHKQTASMFGVMNQQLYVDPLGIYTHDQAPTSTRVDKHDYIVPPGTAVHPAVRASMANLATINFSPQEIQKIEHLPKLHDYGFHAVVNTLLQMEFENPNLIHMYLLYRKYIHKNKKHPRHFPTLTEAQSIFDFSIANDINNIQSVFKLLLFYIKTLPVGKNSSYGDDDDEKSSNGNNNDNNDTYTNIANELETLLALEPNQLLSKMANTNIYPRIYDELLLKNPQFVRELVNLSYDNYSKDTIINILTKAKVPLPDTYQLNDLSPHDLATDGVDIGIKFDLTGQIVHTNDTDRDAQAMYSNNNGKNNIKNNQNNNNNNLDTIDQNNNNNADNNNNNNNDSCSSINKALEQQYGKINKDTFTPLTQKPLFSQSLFLSLFPQDETVYNQHNQSIADGVNDPLLGKTFGNFLGGTRYYTQNDDNNDNNQNNQRNTENNNNNNTTILMLDTTAVIQDFQSKQSIGQ